MPGLVRDWVCDEFYKRCAAGVSISTDLWELLEWGWAPGLEDGQTRGLGLDEMQAREQAA